MYRRPKFLEVLLEIRREMALEADYDVDLFAETARSGKNGAAVSRLDTILDDDPPTGANEPIKLGTTSGA